MKTGTMLQHGDMIFIFIDQLHLVELIHCIEFLLGAQK
jgi:hypothetical protein